MNLKLRFSLVFSCLFSTVLAVVMLTVYYLFADFRREEFLDRLSAKAETTARLLVDVKEINYDLQKTIDRNSITRLYKEQTEVFDEDKNLIYSSSDTGHIEWTAEEFEEVKQEGQSYKKNRQQEELGLHYHSAKKDYYVIISAEDTYGNRKLNYLKYLLIYAFATSTILVCLLSFRVSKRNLKPLDNFRKQIQEITDKNLTVRLSKARHEDEINALAKSFNQMMDRIDTAYHRQREFTGNASHELRTPVARITAQLENLLQNDNLDKDVRLHLTSIAEDTFQLSEIISSLVALTDVSSRRATSFSKIRLDEIIFSAAADLSRVYKDFKLKFEIETTPDNEAGIEINGDETLLKIVMLNLLKNAFLYSNNQLVECLMKQEQNSLSVIFTNTGEVPEVKDPSILFSTFYRGNNTQNKPGSGIGLSIVRRVVQYHNASIVYHIIDHTTNQVVVTFPL